MPAPTPKFIYQTWKTSDPAAWTPSQRQWVRSWARHNPEFSHALYDDADCLAYVAENFPEHLDVYCGLRPVERADLWRYLVVFERGGVYTDMDTICRTPLADWLAGGALVVGLEWDLLDRYPNWRARKRVRSGGPYDPLCYWRDRPVSIGNWTFAAPPSHPLLEEVIRRVAINARDPYFVLEDPAWTVKKTGPGVLTDVIADYALERGTTVEDVARTLRTRPALRVGDVIILDRTALHHGYVRHVGLSSWNPDARVPWRRVATRARILMSWI